MTRTVKRLFIFSLLFCLVLATTAFGTYQLLMKLTRDAVEPIREYPEWENYITYWKSTWLDLIKRYRDSNDGFCFIGAEKHHRILGLDITVRKLEWCFKDDLITRTETDFLGRVITHHEQVGLRLNYDLMLYQILASNNPNGPYSFAYLNNPSLEKHIYERAITAQEVFDTFIELVTKSEYKSDNDYFYVNKWDSPVSINIVDLSNGILLDGKTLTQFVGNYLQELSAITGIDIREGESQLNQGTVLLYFFPKDKPELVRMHLANWVKRMSGVTGYNQDQSKLQDNIDNFNLFYSDYLKRKFNCLSSINQETPNPSEFYSQKVNLKKQWVKIYIPIDKNYLNYCINEEIAQVMGIINDWRDADPSIFNDYSPYEKLTELDKLLLEILYRPEIELGMTRFFIQQPLWRIIKELEAKGRLDSIKKRVFRPTEMEKTHGDLSK